jgi:small-conductance mechanosensitive channel
MPTLFTTDSIDALRRNVVAALPNIAGGVAVIVVFWLLAVFVRAIVSRVSKSKRIEPALVRLMAKVAYIGLIVTGLIMGLGTMGVNVSALVASLGLTGFALGFALKDIISNLLAGVLVILYHTFDEGDRIKVAGFEGKVQRIDLRYTLLDTGSEVVFLPNQLLFNNPVVVVRTEPGSDSEAAAAVPG